MVYARRAAIYLAVAVVVSLLIYYRSSSVAVTVKALRTSVPQVVGLGEYFSSDHDDSLNDKLHASNATLGSNPVDDTGKAFPTTKPPGSNYTRSLVMARTREEDVSWLEDVDLGPEILIFVYVADDPKAPLHPPKNKGHEVMVYLTYILEFYDDLPDVSIFMHSHRYAWHNNDLFHMDASQMISRLSSERVQREGYMNLRCHWVPGCPDWIHPGHVEEDAEKLEQALMATAWAEIFPEKPIPEVLAQPCCSQFALSRDKIQSIPKKTYKYLRDWLSRSEFRDTMSGRIFEYLWQVIFSNETVLCPNQRTCYCDGFGVCFESDAAYDKWYELRWRRKSAEDELRDWEKKAEEIEEFRKDGTLEDIEASELQVPEPGKKEKLQTLIQELGVELEQQRQAAIERGKDPRIRAESAGRPWKEGDGF